MLTNEIKNSTKSLSDLLDFCILLYQHGKMQISIYIYVFLTRAHDFTLPYSSINCTIYRKIRSRKILSMSKEHENILISWFDFVSLFGIWISHFSNTHTYKLIWRTYCRYIIYKHINSLKIRMRFGLVWNGNLLREEIKPGPRESLRTGRRSCHDECWKIPGHRDPLP